MIRPLGAPRGIDTRRRASDTPAMPINKPAVDGDRRGIAPTAAALLLLVAAPTPKAVAQTSAPPGGASPQSAPDLPEPDAGEGSKLQFAISPYIWITSLNGSVSFRSVKTDIDGSFLDILQNSDQVFGLMGAIDLRYDRFVCQSNGTWLTAEVDEQHGVARNTSIDADVTFDTTWLEVFAGYRLIEQPLGDNPAEKRLLILDAFVGGRVTLVDVDSTLTASATITLPGGTVLSPSASRNLNSSQDWAEPFVGLRLGADLSERWSVLIRGDIGGFGVGSDFAWQAVGAVGYRWWTDFGSITLYGGYRALSQDYTNGDFNWDLTVHGPIIGLRFTF